MLVDEASPPFAIMFAIVFDITFTVAPEDEIVMLEPDIVPVTNTLPPDACNGELKTVTDEL